MAFLLHSCGNDERSTGPDYEPEKESGTTTLAQGTAASGSLEEGGLKITPLKSSGKFDEASIKINEETSEVNEAYVKTYRFDLENFDINDPANNIILIHNNAQTQTLMRASGKQAMIPAANNVMLAYCYNNMEGGIRSERSYVLKNELFDATDQLDKTASHLFYNYPRGTYEANSDLQIPLDFFVLNATLAPDKYHVRVTIDSTSFELTHWSTYVIEGLEKGTHTCRIELLDHDGVNIFGPFTDSGTRTFEILSGEEIAGQ